jgi:glycosyltransferase involved in cell wall biosynthesis
VRFGLDANPIFRRRAGVGQYAVRLVERMSAASPGDEFFLYYWGTEENPDEDWLRRENVIVRRVPSKRAFESAVRADRIDVFHGTNFRRRARGQRGSVITIHDLALKIFPHLRRRWLGDWIGYLKTSRDARLSERVIADSEATARDVVRYIGVPREKVRVIHLAAGLEFRPVEDKGKLAWLLARIGMNRPRYILFSGTLEPRKNVPVLLRAYLGLRGEHPDAGLVLAGTPGWKSGEITDFLRANGMADDVRITGYLTPQDLALLYSGASVFVLPSLHEGFGLPPLEAMACGAPVIVSDGGSLPEVVGDAAIVLPPNDVEGYRREISRVLSSTELAREMREKGFRRASLFSWDKTAVETLAVYREVAG